MKIQIMNQEALEFFKGNMKDLYNNYFTETTNDWMFEAYKGEIFKTYKTIPDIDLMDLRSGRREGEVDVENIKRLYSALQFLTPSQASDERLWAGMCCGEFYSFMRNRTRYDQGKKPKKFIPRTINTQYYFYNNSAGKYRNLLAKLWWVGHLLYDETRTDPFEKVDILGPADISSKISEIFFSYSYSSNKNVLNGIIRGFKHYNDLKLNINVRHWVRPMVQELNLIGAVQLLDTLSEKDIAEIVIEKMEQCRLGNDGGIDEAESVDEEDPSQESDEFVQEVVDKNTIVIESPTKGTIPLMVNQNIAATMAYIGKRVGDRVLFKGEECTIVEIK